MLIESLPEVRSLSDAQKWQLMLELEAQFWGDDAESARTTAILAELDERKRHYQQHPTSAMSLEEARRRMFDSRP